MTFSVELFLCVVVGLGLGYAIFYNDEDTHVTTNPCCNFIQDEANERRNDLRKDAAAAAANAAAMEEDATEVDFHQETRQEQVDVVMEEA